VGAVPPASAVALAKAEPRTFRHESHDSRAVSQLSPEATAGRPPSPRSILMDTVCTRSCTVSACLTIGRSSPARRSRYFRTKSDCARESPERARRTSATNSLPSGPLRSGWAGAHHRFARAFPRKGPTSGPRSPPYAARSRRSELLSGRRQGPGATSSLRARRAGRSRCHSAQVQRVFIVSFRCAVLPWAIR
jgi:hypothetical protein